MGLRDRLREVARPSRPGADGTASGDPFDDLFDRRPPAGAIAAEPPGGLEPPAWSPPAWPAARSDLPEARADLAGLLLEMARLGRFNHPLLERRAFEVLDLEERGTTPEAPVDEPLPRRVTRRARRATVTGLTRCGSCQAAVPADANFCAYCGMTLGSAP